MSTITVVIPSWNGRHLLEVCLAALNVQTAPDFDTVVVDNGSTDGTVAWLRERHPHVRVIANDNNLGFAAAVNQGIRAGKGRYVVTLNNDTEPAAGWLAALVEAVESSPSVGMCASKMLFADRPGVINSAGICVDRTGIAWDRQGGETDDPAESAWAEIFGPCGGAALYRREMLVDVGDFDEAYFAYLEDVDLAWRGRARGWRCLYVPAARVLHRHSATSIEGSPFKRYQLGRNKVRLLAKNYPFRQLPWAALLTIVYDAGAVAYSLVARRDLHALRGRIAGLAALREALRQRPRLERRPDIPYLSPVAPPWRVSSRYSHLSAPK